MSWWEAVLILLAGTAAGAINAAVGSGTLITFPALIALGFSPLTANVSNNIGLVPGAFAGAWGYRGEIAPHRRILARLVPCSAVGGVIGAVLLFVLPPGAFSAIVPVLIALALILVVLQPRLARALRPSSTSALPSVSASVPVSSGPASGASRDPLDGAPNETAAPSAPPLTPRTGWPTSRLIGVGLMVGVFAAGLYGGYFGAAQGVLLIGLLGWLLTDDLQTANGLKNVLSTVVNGMAAVAFLIVAPGRVNWAIVLLIAVGSTIGGLIGSSVGRRAPAPVLRGVIVVVGLIAIARLVFT